MSRALILSLLLLSCTSDDSGGSTTQIADTTSADLTTGSDATTGDGTSSTTAWTDETTNGGGVGLCGALSWIHPNPPIKPGGGGPEWYRSIGVDLTGCNAAVDVKVAIAPVGDNALILTLGQREPSCVLVGAPEAAGVESVGFQIGQDAHWSAVSVAVLVDDVVTDTVELPKMVAPEDQPLVMDGLTDRALFRFDGSWWVAAADAMPACW